VTALGPGSKRALTTLATLVVVIAALVAATEASAAVETFTPVAKTRHSLVFRIAGIDPGAVRKASVTLRFRHGHLRRKNLSVRSIRRAVDRGRLHVRRGSARVRRHGRHGSSKAAGIKRGAKGGRVKVVVQESPTTSPSSVATAQPPNISIDEPTGAVYTAPPSVPAGCSADATQAILTWIASVPDNSTVRFAQGACYRIEGTLELKHRDLAIDGNGSTFRSLDAPTAQRAIWRVWDSTVRIRNMTIVGSYTNGGVHTEELQWAHAIDLRGTRALVENLSMSDVAGDCVYFGLGASRSSGIVRDSSCRAVGRNAVSVVAGDDIRVERMTTDRIGYIAFDVEPNTGAGNGSSRVLFDSNTIGSYQMKAYTVIGNAPVSDQAFTNNRVVGSGLRVVVENRSDRPQRLAITGNSSDTPTGNNALGIDGVDDLSVTGNTVPLTEGTLAQVAYSCRVAVSGNTYPGGSTEDSIVSSTC
jgi:hypothetical protein